MSHYAGESVLDLFSTYAINRNNYIYKLLEKALPSSGSKIRVLEFGAGKGEFINRFSDNSKFETYAVESDDNFRKLLQKHNSFATLEDLKEKVDFIFLIDVLEHLKDDERYLRTLKGKLNTGGRLFIYVPARNELYSEFDKRIGHFRRYSKKELKSKLHFAGFTCFEIHYHELPGYFISFFHNKLLNKISPTALSIKAYDQILPFTNFIEGIIKPPIGKSLYAVATIA